MKQLLLCLLGLTCVCLAKGDVTASELYQKIISEQTKSVRQITDAALAANNLPEGYNILAAMAEYYSVHKDTIKFDSKSVQQCMKDITSTISLPWMNAYDDATAKRPSGVLNGNIKWYGDFDECLNIPPKKPLLEERYFNPKFCDSAAVPVNASGYFFVLGLCLPDTCNEQDIIILGNTVLPPATGFRLLASKTYCQRTDLGLDHLDPYTYIALAIFSTIAFFMVAGQLVEIYLRFRPVTEKKDQVVGKFTKEETNNYFGHFGTMLMYFSPWANLEKLLAIPPVSTKVPNLSALNGMRALSLAYVVLGHVVFFSIQMTDNLVSVHNNMRLFTYQFVLAGYMAVDTFFYLSGFLAYWSLFRKLTMTKVNIVVRFVMAYVYRYIRISVPHFALILIMLGLFPILSYGPFYNQKLDAACSENWWVNLIYMNNFVHPELQCVGWTWYLMVDMQVFLVIPFLVYFFVRWPLLGWICSTALLLGDIISSITITLVENLPAVPNKPPDYEQMLIEFNEEERAYENHYIYLYIKPYSRMGPYIIGVMFCHLLVKHQKSVKRIFFSKYWVQAIGWFVTFAIFLSIIYARADVNAGHRLENHATEAIYAGFVRNAWALALGWITIACALNKGGIVGQILQWNLWAVPARLSYAGYLVHPLIMLFYVYTTRRAYYFTDITTGYYFCSTYVITLMVSAIYSLAFESPVIGLLKSL